MDKILFTLATKGWEPEITAMTFPLLERYAKKIGAKFHVIEDRKYPEWPAVYEKFQIWDLVKKMDAEWYIYIDADALIHPNSWDYTAVVNKDTTLSYGSDFVPMRFRPDKYFLRDGRMIGKGNWILMASEWCTDIWHPLEDMTIEEAANNMFPVLDEINTVKSTESLIDDYVVSRNIARYGLKHMLLPDLIRNVVPIGTQQTEMIGHLIKFIPGIAQYAIPNQKEQNIAGFAHQYLMKPEQKVVWMQDVLRQWKVKI